MHITLDLLPGDDFTKAAEQAYSLALGERHSVDFKFNGVLFVAVPASVEGKKNLVQLGCEVKQEIDIESEEK